MTRRNQYRLTALAAIILLSGILFWIGKGHTLLFDNKDITVNGQQYQAGQTLQVTLDDQKPIVLKSGTRKKAKNMVAGPWHSLKIDVLDKEKKIVNSVEKKFSLNLSEMFVLNIPALLGEASEWIQEFEPPRRR